MRHLALPGILQEGHEMPSAAAEVDPLVNPAVRAACQKVYNSGTFGRVIEFILKIRLGHFYDSVGRRARNLVSLRIAIVGLRTEGLAAGFHIRWRAQVRVV